MDGEANLPAPPPESESASTNLIRPINPNSNLFRSFKSSSSLSSPSGLLRDVQAAFKRHRPVGLVQSHNIKPRRTFVPQRVVPKILASTMDQTADPNKAQCEPSRSEENRAGDSVSQQPETVSIVKNNQVDAAVTPPPMLGTITSTYEESIKPNQQDQPQPLCDIKEDAVVSSGVAPQHTSLVDNHKKVHFSLESNQETQGAGDRMATGSDNILSHISSLALTEMEWDVSNRPEVATSVSYDTKHQYPVNNLEPDKGLKHEGISSSSLAKRTAELQDRMHQFRNFLQGDFSQPMTQSSVVGSTCATTTLVNSASAPMASSTTYCSHSHQNSCSYKGDLLGEDHNTLQPPVEGHMVQPSYPSSRCTDRMSVDKVEIAQASSTSVDIQMEVREYEPAKELPRCEAKVNDMREDPPLIDDKITKEKGNAVIGSDLQHQALSKATSLDVKSETLKLEKQEKVASSKVAPRKRNYDPDLFFKVNGKLYQRLGKIGSGGSSEVHKVISSDCHIYALKRIKLKGRDYATAYGFCQEIEYLNKLKGKSNIIQLIDYEVTDRTLLREVMKGSGIDKDGRVKDDGFIYMVLEYGEIDLAHMLSHKWKEMDDADSIIDENWLRFYWQQILLAVNTIHEERIVHSDLKPANFLLVRGSLKLIDFGIAKAIMSDTTNIQRDSQVGTLSYMSPEAFMCNEKDANGNIIKCGRPSDIWSLGCILYQMVYGKTPFAKYTTFWNKFKVITDPNHKIDYEPVPNPWLVDLMKKCLAWERNERWRIPELLQHPFLVPPIQPPPSLSHQDRSCKLLELVGDSFADNKEALNLCNRLQEILGDSRPGLSQVDQQRSLLLEMSSLCFRLQEQLVD